jgi:hypothetical protein
VVAVAAYALRRTSARLVFVLALGGLVWAVFRVARPPHHPAVGSLRVVPARLPILGSSPWEMAFAALVVAVAAMAATVLYRERSTRR